MLLRLRWCLWLSCAVSVAFAHSDGEKVLLLSTHQPRHWLFTLRTQNFVDNTEYFNKIMEGETLFGFHCLFGMHYLLDQSVALNLGLLWQRKFGDTDPWDGVRPTFSIAYKRRDITSIVGIVPLQDCLPTLLEPLFDPRHLLYKPYLEGIYFSFENEPFYGAIWLDWCALLAKKENRPEIFTVYGEAGYKNANVKKTLGWHLPFQWAIYHLGGQGISAKAYSLFCGASGLVLTFWPGNGLFKQVACASYLLFDRYAQAANRPCAQGWGQLYTIDGIFPHIGLNVSYWHGSDFSSENIGIPLYQSIRIKDNMVTAYEPIRALWFASIYKTWLLSTDLHIRAAVQPYYDVHNKLLEYGLSCILSYRLAMPLA